MKSIGHVAYDLFREHAVLDLPEWRTLTDAQRDLWEKAAGAVTPKESTTEAFVEV